MKNDGKDLHLIARHFDRQAHDWDLKLQANGSMKRRPKQFVDLLCSHVPHGGRVLDFGCGSGDITQAIKLAGFDVRGVDRSSGMLDQARKRFGYTGIRFDSLPMEDRDDLPYESGNFDAVLASSVLEYVRRPEATLRELRRVCRSSGILIMTIPDMRTPRRWVEQALRPLAALAMTSRVARFCLFGEYLRLSRNRFGVRKWDEMLAVAGWVSLSIHRERNPLMVIICKAS